MNVEKRLKALFGCMPHEADNAELISIAEEIASIGEALYGADAEPFALAYRLIGPNAVVTLHHPDGTKTVLEAE